MNRQKAADNFAHDIIHKMSGFGFSPQMAAEIKAAVDARTVDQTEQAVAGVWDALRVIPPESFTEHQTERLLVAIMSRAKGDASRCRAVVDALKATAPGMLPLPVIQPRRIRDNPQA